MCTCLDNITLQQLCPTFFLYTESNILATVFRKAEKPNAVMQNFPNI